MSRNPSLVSFLIIQKIANSIDTPKVSIKIIMEKFFAALFFYIGVMKIANSTMITFDKRNMETHTNLYKLRKGYFETFPFSSVVLLNTGCTGSLISCKHILTAAHCLHDGKKNLDVEVGLLRKDGNMKWLDVKKVFVPVSWKNNHRGDLSKHDYGVIELKQELSRKWMDFSVNDVKAGTVIQVLGSPSSEQVRELHLATCPIHSQSKNYIYNRCKISKGMSGSPFYIYDATQKKRRIIGILSARIKVSGKEMNMAVALSPHIVNKISKWIKDGGDCTDKDQ